MEDDKSLVVQNKITTGKKVTPDLREIIKEEYKRCALDPVYFIKKYVKIQHPKHGTINFSLYPFQEDTLTQFKNNSKNIVLKCRQMGISTLVSSYTLWLMTFFPDKNILVIATKQEVAKNLVTKVRFANNNLPNWIKQQSTEDNRLSLRLKNGSQVKAVSAAADAGRSEALSLLVCDEVAFIDEIEDIWLSAQSAMTHGGGNAILLSTPNGCGNFFHKIWIDADSKKNDFNPIRLHWKLHPEYDQKWRDDQTKLLGEKGAAQECDTQFNSSGNTLVELELLDWYINKHVKEPLEKRGIDNGYWIWEYADYKKDYIVVADVARGDGSDYSAFHILETETLTQVAEYQGKITTSDFGNMLVNVSVEYNNALLIIERENIGHAAIQQVIDRKYQNLFYSSSDLLYVEVERQLTNKFHAEDKKLAPGFSTNVKTRPLIISKLDLYMREKIPVIRSVRLCNELTTFAWINGKAQAITGYNDDLVMSFAIGMWIRDTALRLKQEGIHLQKKILERIGGNKYDGGVYNAANMIKTPEQHMLENKQKRQDQMRMQTGKSEENLDWLL